MPFPMRLLAPLWRSCSHAAGQPSDVAFGELQGPLVWLCTDSHHDARSSGFRAHLTMPLHHVMYDFHTFSLYDEARRPASAAVAYMGA